MKKPHYRDFHTDDGLHAAMDKYAQHKSHKGTLRVDTYFADGSGGTLDFIERERAPIYYKTRDGETYEVSRRTHRFVDWVYSEEPLTSGKMKEAVTKWLNSFEPVPTSIKFTLDK